MKLFNILVLSTLIASSAYADRMQPALLGLVCVSDDSAKVIKIASDSSGSALTVDGNIIDESLLQITVSTEGGPPYFQYVKGGYNITISGGDLETAFYDPSMKYLGGLTNASVWYDGATYSAICKGVIAF